MYCAPITKDEILKIITKLKNNKCPGTDCLTPKLLKSVAGEISNPLSYLLNLSFATGTVPSALKLAKVIPVYKKGDKHLVNNYRPISLLNILEKILENLCTAGSIHIFVTNSF